MSSHTSFCRKVVKMFRTREYYVLCIPTNVLYAMDYFVSGILSENLRTERWTFCAYFGDNRGRISYYVNTTEFLFIRWLDHICNLVVFLDF